MSAGEWKVHYVHECGWWDEPAFGNPWFTVTHHGHTCPRCGDHLNEMFRTVTRRRVSDAVLLKPWTWFSWHWQVKP